MAERIEELSLNRQERGQLNEINILITDDRDKFEKPHHFSSHEKINRIMIL